MFAFILRRLQAEFYPVRQMGDNMKHSQVCQANHSFLVLGMYSKFATLTW